MAFRYYSTQRPIAPGTFPKPYGNQVVKINNFQQGRVFVPEIGRDAWGYVEYENPLSTVMASNFELILDYGFPVDGAAGKGVKPNV